MEKRRVLGFAALALFGALTGCSNKIVMIVPPSPAPGDTASGVILASEAGQILEWRAMNKSVGDFTIEFIGPPPCAGPFHSTGGVFYCKVFKQASASYFHYNIKLDNGPEQKMAKGCKNCLIIISPTSDRSDEAKLFIPPVPTPQPATKLPYPGGEIDLSCQSGLVAAPTPDGNVSSVFWASELGTQGWSATFSSSPCAEPGPFNATNNVCTFAASATQGKYYYTLSNVGSCANTDTKYEVDVPSPPH